MRKIYVVIFGLFMALPAFSQQLPIFSLYRENSFMLNPAIAGSEDHAIAMASYRQQWVKIDGAPRTVLASYRAPVKKRNLGFGATVLNDQAGPVSYTGLTFSAAYHISFEKINPFRWPEFLRNSKISIGLSGSIYQYRLNSTQLLLDQANDPLINTVPKSTWFPNAGLGIYYYYDKFYLGFSIPNVVPANIMFDNDNTTSDLKQALHYYAVGGGKIPFNQGYKTVFSLEPMLWFRYVAGAPWLIDADLRFKYKNVFWIGAGYRTSQTLIFDIGVTVAQHIEIAYAYDQQVSNIRTYIGTSHEIMIAYHFDSNKHTRYHSYR